uniref:Programmed cell death protein 2-like n=2 Tax=Cacopsylla melanoneura TaxID=428564 RepID=A0A8D8YRH9_9HEMI
MASKNPTVYLGYIDELIRECSSSSIEFTSNKIGGKPVWATDIKNSTPSCKICGLKLILVAQLYAPLENSPYHRCLFVFACINSSCWNQNKSWVCIRCQVIDPTYIVHNPVVEMKTIVNKNVSSEWCGDAEDWGSESEGDDENGNVETGITNLSLSEECSQDNNASSIVVGATGSVTTPVASAEIEGGEEDVVEMESPVSSQVNVMSLLHSSVSVPQVSSQQAFQFVPYYLNFDPEVLDTSSSPDSHVASLLHAYSKCHPVDNAISSGGCDGGEGYEKSVPGHGDKMFHRFVSRVRQNPGHVIRYCRDNSEILWMSRSEPVSELRCRNCHAPLQFECQLLSTLIPCILLQLSPNGSGEEGHLEFGCVYVFTCSENCWSDGDVWREETVIVQAEVY